VNTNTAEGKLKISIWALLIFLCSLMVAMLGWTATEIRDLRATSLTKMERVEYQGQKDDLTRRLDRIENKVDALVMALTPRTGRSY